MAIFKGYPEINFVDGQADGLHRIETNTGKVIIAGHFDNPELGQRLVDCWNAVRKIFAPAAHIEATDDYCARLEGLRKEAVARIELLEAGIAPVASSDWTTDMSFAPKGKIVQRTVTTKEGPKNYADYQRDDIILASKCGKVIKSYWIPDEGRWAGFSAGEQPVAWMAWPSHPDTNPRAKASVDNAATNAPETASAGREMQVGAEPRGSVPATSDGGRDSVERHAPISQETAQETMGGTGDDCSFGNRGVWPPQGGASSSHGNDSLSVVTAGETATLSRPEETFPLGIIPHAKGSAA